MPSLNLVAYKIRVKGFGWADLHHPWSENGVEFSPEELLTHLVDKIIPQQSKRRLPSEPTMNLPSRKYTPQLGTQTSDVAKLEERYEKERDIAVAEAITLREQKENDGTTDHHEKLQPTVSPAVDEALIGSEIELLAMFILQIYKITDFGMNWSSYKKAHFWGAPPLTPNTGRLVAKTFFGW